MRPQDGSSQPSVGRVQRIGPNGQLILESDEEPVDLGTRCQREDGTPSGVVTDIIGPVQAPLVIVDPTRGPNPGSDERPTGEDLIGTTLYPR